MSRKTTSQWEFGELISPAQTRKIHTVSEITGNVRRAIEQAIGEVWITGEVTNLRIQTSGHIYFTLKDPGAQLTCVVFRGEAAARREFLRDGANLVLQGNLTVYEPRGQYQLIVRVVEPQGVGALQVAFENLKRKLQVEGLFAPERKRPLPRYPMRIGLVTSPTGAAVRDVLHVIERRHPGLEIILAPCRVQGEGAAAEISNAIRLLNLWNSQQPRECRLQLILLTRGGGSLEDLWAFNEESVARAIFESELPVVSAVGHEIDFTISDFVADLRAATPSAAAEIITQHAFAARQTLIETARRLRQRTRHRLEAALQEVIHWRARLNRLHPRRRIADRWQRLDDLQSTLVRRPRQAWRERASRFEQARRRWARIRLFQLTERKRSQLMDLAARLQKRARYQLELARSSVREVESRLRLLSPESVLARGYSITEDAITGQIIRSVQQVTSGQELKTRLADGSVRSTTK